MTTTTPHAIAWSAPFDELSVGDAFATPGREVSREDVRAFAALTGDHHPQHVDPAWAARSPFGQPIAHGMLVLSLAVGLLPLDPERVVALRRVGDCVFKRPVLFGDTIGVRGTIAALQPVSDEAGLVTCAWAVRDEHERLVARARAEILWAR